jgi:hypothetical protein
VERPASIRRMDSSGVTVATRLDSTKNGDTSPPDFAALGEALAVAHKHEHVVTQLLTLAVEYEAKTITAERYAERSLDIFKREYGKLVKAA